MYTMSRTHKSTGTMSPGKIRLAHLVTHPIQYFAPLYRRAGATARL